MTVLSPEAEAMLEDARRSHGPSGRDRERVLSTLHASLGIAVPLALASSVAEAASQAGAPVLDAVAASGAQVSAAGQTAGTLSAPGGWGYAGKLLTWKAGKVLLATVALGGAVGVGLTQLPRSEQHVQIDARTTRASARPAAREDEPAHEHAARPAEVEPARAVEVAVPAAVPSPNAVTTDTALPLQHDTQEAPTRAALAHDVASVRVARQPGAGRTSTRTSTVRTRVHRESVHAQALQPASSDSAPVAAVAVPEKPAPLELELIRRAMTSLRDREPALALALLEEHESRYPAGAFATERRGLHAVALCAAGRLADGKREQAAFLRQHGETPIAARVRRACVEPRK